jgi:hypothetical protein
VPEHPFPAVPGAFDGAFRVHLAHLDRRLRMIGEHERRKITEDFQSRLVVHRIKHGAQVLKSEFDVPALRPEVRMLARVLGSAIAEVPALRDNLSTLLKEYEDDIDLGAPSSERCIVEALLNLSHAKQEDKLVYVGELASSANRILKERGFHEKLEPKGVGWTLRYSLNFTPKRSGKGFEIRMTESVCRRIHDLALELQVWNEGVAGCSYCGAKVAGGDEVDQPSA